METTNHKKRYGKEILCTDISTNSKKKYKRKNSEYTTIFLEALSTLPEQRKISSGSLVLVLFLVSRAIAMFK